MEVRSQQGLGVEMMRRPVRPAGQGATDGGITADTALTTGQAAGAVTVAGAVVFLRQAIRGLFWGGLAALVVNFVSRPTRKTSRRSRR